MANVIDVFSSWKFNTRVQSEFSSLSFTRAIAPRKPENRLKSRKDLDKNLVNSQQAANVFSEYFNPEIQHSIML